ncbi:MAG: hypothetical protein Kow0074_18460 [Candidatus Zixiibacteriota bacterium]
MPSKAPSKARGLSMQFDSERVRRHAPLVLAGLVTLLIIWLYAEDHRILATWELAIQDVMVETSKKHDPPSGIVICTIDDSAVEKLGAWPWDAERVGYVVGMLSEYNPRAIGLDFELTEDATYDPIGNNFLADMIDRAGNVVLPVRFTLGDDPHPPMDLPKSILSSSIVTIDQALELINYSYPRGIRISYPYQAAADAAWGLGQTNTWQDVDGKVRRDPLIVKFQGEYYPSMALQLALCAMDATPGQTRIDPGKGITLESEFIPTDDKGLFRIDYRGREGTFKSVSAADVLEGKDLGDAVRDKIVIVGVTAKGYGTSLVTPASDVMPRSEKIATVTANILDKRFLNTIQLSGMVDILIFLGIGLLAALGLPKIPKLYRFVILGITLFVFVNLNFVLYNSFNVIVNTLYPSLQILLFLCLAAFMKPSTDERVQSVFGKKKSVKPVAKKPAPEVPEESQPTTAISAPTPSSDRVKTRVVRENQAMGAIGGLERTQTVSVGRIGDDTPTRASDVMNTSPRPLGADLSGSTPTQTIQSPEDANRKSLGRYEILGVLGQGAMGTVYKGKDPAIDRMVALKTIRTSMLDDPVQAAELAERLVREAKAAGKMSHPNIVTIYDVGSEGELNYIAMEYLEGYTLEQVIKRNVQLNYTIVAKIIMQVCAALSYAHNAGIVHRDIKPANIMVLNDFKIKVTDFGIARFDSPSMSMTQTGIAMGTPHYISPEQLKGGDIDRRCDIFSLGVVAYEMLTRRRPFQADNLSALIYAITQTVPDPPSSIDENIPGLFDMVVMRALKRDPIERYQTADQMANDLKAFIEEAQITRF